MRRKLTGGKTELTSQDDVSDARLISVNHSIQGQIYCARRSILNTSKGAYSLVQAPELSPKKYYMVRILWSFAPELRT